MKNIYSLSSTILSAVIAFAMIFGLPAKAIATSIDSLSVDSIATVTDIESEELLSPTLAGAVAALPDSLQIGIVDLNFNSKTGKNYPRSIYAMPYSWNGTCYDWKRMLINGSVLAGAFIGTLVVLETAPEGATNWSKAEIRKTPWYERWKNHVIDQGPQFDKDKWYFNYLLHPYAGAVYFMGARSCGFNFWQSLLFSSIISNVFWEFGIEATMERPSLQDLFITPVIGSLVGEGFYRLKRIIVDNNYSLLGSKVFGNIVAFLIDPLNEVLGLLYGNPARQVAKMRRLEITSSPIINPGAVGTPQYGLSVTCIF